MIIFYNRLCFLPISLFTFLVGKFGKGDSGMKIEPFLVEAFPPVDASVILVVAVTQGGSDRMRDRRHLQEMAVGQKGGETDLWPKECCLTREF